MARGRPPTTPSESDNEPEDLTLPVGAEAEVRSDDPGFVGSFYEVTVAAHRGRRYTVLYSTLEAEDGGPHQETAAAADVRPRPPPREGTREFVLHEAVEALHNGGWWAGVVSSVPPPAATAGAPLVYKVTFPTSRETMEFEETALRPHRVFRGGSWVLVAEAAEDGRPLFPVGTQVEVSRSATSFAQSWTPASVLQVIAATNFLVQYAHIGQDEEVATEIIDSQYIRPARNDTPMDRVSPSCHVEVIHDGSWWPGVIREVLGCGINKKYVVELKSHATHMEDVECLDALIVGITQLRLHFDWDGKQWIRHLSEESVNGTKLTSKKRPSSSAMSLYTQVGEIGDKCGSYREKKLKNADVVSEPTSPLLSVCINNNDILHTSSSYPEEPIIQGNAVAALGSHLAPLSLTSMAELAYLRDSSLAQSSHLEQASSPKIITPSALVHRDPQLQASLLGSFVQPRPVPVPQVSLLGMPSHNPQIPKKRTSAKSIEEARNTVPISEDLASRKNGDYDGELGYNLTAGRGMVSEMNTGICVDPTLPPKDAGGPQHSVSQQGGGSAMDGRYSESLATEVLPFVKTSPIWPQIEAMEIFSKAPQRPHFNQLWQHSPDLHEGMALGLMLSFANLGETINRLDVENDIERLFEEKMHALSLLEAYGFDVGALRSRLEALLCSKKRHHAKLHDDAMKTFKDKIARKENDDRELGMQMRVLAMAIDHLELYARLMRDMMRSAVTQKMNNAMEISRLKAEANELERS